MVKYSIHHKGILCHIYFGHGNVISGLEEQLEGKIGDQSQAIVPPAKDMENMIKMQISPYTEANLTRIS